MLLSQVPSPDLENENGVQIENLGLDTEADDLVSSRTPYGLRSSSSQSRDRQTILDAAHGDRSAILGTGAQLLSQENEKAAATVVKRVNADPSIGEPLLKCLKKMEADLEQDRVTPIASLAYLLGFCHVPDLNNFNTFSDIIIVKKQKELYLLK